MSWGVGLAKYKKNKPVLTGGRVPSNESIDIPTQLILLSGQALHYAFWKVRYIRITAAAATKKALTPRAFPSISHLGLGLEWVLEMAPDSVLENALSVVAERKRSKGVPIGVWGWHHKL